MIFTLLLCLALSILLGFYVVAPLVRNYRGVPSESVNGSEVRQSLDGNIVSAVLFKGFTDENELRQTLQLRDHLLQYLIYGRSGSEAVNSLSRQMVLDAVVSLCERLKMADILALPEKVSKPAVTKILLVLAGFFGSLSVNDGGLFKNPLLSQAHAQAQEQAQPQAPQAESTSARRMPGLLQQDGIQFASVHQFVLSPRLGKLGVYYLTAFPNPEGLTEVVLGLPFPQGFTDLKISSQDAVLETGNRGYPVVRLPLKSTSVTELRAEFSLDAPFGTFDWKNDVVPQLPGTILILMPEYQSALRNMTESWFPGFNLWPARIVGVPESFKSVRRKEEYDPSEQNYQLLMRLPPEYTRNVIRTAEQPSAYPEFSVVGIVPSRVPLYLLAALMGSFFVGTALYTMKRKSAERLI